MTSRARSSRRGRGKGRPSIFPVLLGIIGGLLLATVCLLLYLRFGRPPVAVTDSAAFWEPLVTHVPLEARARAETKPAPFPASEEVFESAAGIYRVQCAQCHGTPGHDAQLGHAMLPRAQQFFHRRVAQPQSAGELFWKTAFGVRHSGMPAYRQSLTNTQLWQLALLLHAGGGDLPEPVSSILTSGIPGPQPTEVRP